MSETPISGVDTLIIGAGVIGSALAMALAEKGATHVRVVDVDLEGSLSSSELNAGGVRATWNQPINLEAARLSIEYFARHAEPVGYRPLGYLWMHGSERMRELEPSLKLWQRAGWPVEVWSVDQLRSKRPFIDQTDDLGGAVFAPRDGLVNPNLLKMHFREKARELGVIFQDRLKFVDAKVGASGVDLSFLSLPGALSAEQKRRWLCDPSSADSETVTIRASRVVNCAGPWAAQVAQTLGYRSPAYAVRRQISLFDCRDVDLTPYGMMIDPSGVYFHPEATYILSGIAEREEPAGMNFAYGGEEFFQEKIWLPLSQRSSKFERLRHVTGWGGLYEVSPDESAIVGEVKEAGLPAGRFYESHSYSGHGVMHSYAAGQALAEKILHGRYETLDLSPLAGTRFAEGRLVSETAVI